MDKINGLALGADDYMTKPFLPLELVARIKAQLRRYKRYNSPSVQETEEVLTHKGLVINKKTRECILNERPLSLTPTEFEILAFLCEKKGKLSVLRNCFIISGRTNITEIIIPLRFIFGI